MDYDQLEMVFGKLRWKVQLIPVVVEFDQAVNDSFNPYIYFQSKC